MQVSSGKFGSQQLRLVDTEAAPAERTIKLAPAMAALAAGELLLIIDGADGARFLRRIVNMLADPFELVLGL